MLDALGGFLDALRARGLPVAPAAALEAARALAAVGIERRAAVREALRLTLAHDRRERQLVGEEFERYFAAPGRRASGGDRPRQRAAGAGRGAPGGDAGASPPRTRPLPRRGSPRPGHGEPSQASGATSERLRELARKRDRRLARLVLATPAPERPPAGRRAAALPGADLRRLELRGPLPDATEVALLEEAARMVAELRRRESRRRRRARRGSIALRRTLRSSLQSGGVPFVLARERRRRRRPRLVLLLDASHSVARAAGLFLVLAGRLLAELAAARVFAFVDRPVDATAVLGAWTPAGAQAGATASFRAALAPLPGLDLAAASDYGRAFHRLLDEPALRPARDLVLVVLGDGRSNRLDPLAWAFAELTRRARLAVWLVPERRDEWGTGDSALGEYLPEVDLAVEAADLAGLVRGLGETLREMRA